MNCRIASLLLATTLATATATTSSKAYRTFSFSEPPRPKSGKAFPLSFSSVSEEGFITAKSSKLHSPSSSLSIPSAKTVKSKVVQNSISSDDDESFITPKSSKLHSLSSSLPMPSAKTVKSKMGKKSSSSEESAQPTNAPSAKPTSSPTHAPTHAPTAQPTNAPSAKPTSSPTHAPTAQPTNAPSAKPTRAPTHAPTAQPTTRRPTQRMVCQSGDFVDALGRDCFWYEDPNVELGCESLRDQSTDVDLTNDEGKTPWDECCFCGGGTMVPEDTLQRRNLRVVAEPKDLGAADQKMEAI